MLTELTKLRTEFEGEAAQRKLDLLRALDGTVLKRASEVVRLHDALCFFQAYPDNASVLNHVSRMLTRFDHRRDLRRFREELTGSGIKGAPIAYAFFAPTAQWLAKRCGPSLTIDWDALEDPEKLDPLLSFTALYSELSAVDEFDHGVRGWLDRLSGDDTDAAFLVRRLADLRMDPFVWEQMYNDLDIPLRLAPGPGTPSRTESRFDESPIRFQEQPLSRERPSVKAEMARPPKARRLSSAARRTLVNLARETMVVHNRELDVFSYAEPKDVSLFDAGPGLQIALIGAAPERRLMFEALYGYLILKNGVPVGYGTASSLFGSSEIALNVFESYRVAGEAALFFVRLLSLAKMLFGSDTFALTPYQLGEDNEEAVRSGAWWFYQKLGFRARDPEVLSLMNRERARMAKNPRHRSTPVTLRKLASANVYLQLRRGRDDVLGMVSLADIGLNVSRYLSDRFGADRKKAERVCRAEAADLLGVRSLRRFSPSERLAWTRWAPLVLVLPGVNRWPPVDRKALMEVIRSKGGPREVDFVRRFDRHRRLRAAVSKLAASNPHR